MSASAGTSPVTMEYAITLPADYDMGIIRHRVATRGRALDGLAGLDFKAYLVRERGRAGSPVHQYAPFYLWQDARAMTGFLRGPGFAGLCADFGRPTVRQATGALRLTGPAGQGDEPPRSAIRHVVAIPEDGAVPEAVDRAEEELRRYTTEPALHTAVLVLDPHRWELVRFSLWTVDAEAVPEGRPGERYQVLHLSEGPVDR